MSRALTMQFVDAMGAKPGSGLSEGVRAVQCLHEAVGVLGMENLVEALREVDNESRVALAGLFVAADAEICIFGE